MSVSAEKCINCSQKQICRDSLVSWFFFGIGVISAVALRAVTVLMSLNPNYGKIAWYVGVLGFFLFFIYKFKISRLRARLIQQHKLMNVIASRRPLSEGESKLISEILCGLTSNKERVNYLIIFLLSGLALAFAIYIDFFRF